MNLDSLNERYIQEERFRHLVDMMIAQCKLSEFIESEIVIKEMELQEEVRLAFMLAMDTYTKQKTVKAFENLVPL